MVIRSSSSPDFRSAQIKRGQRWLPLVALLPLSFAVSAAPNTGGRLQVSRQQTQLAEAPAINEQQVVTGQKLAQAEPSPGNRGVVQLLNQVEALNGELNRLRGQIEELANDVSSAKKRQRDMYVDLDTRLRRIEQSSASKRDQDTIAALEERIRKLEQGSAPPASIAPPAPIAPAVASATVAPPGNPPPPAMAPPPAAAQASAASAISIAATAPGTSNSPPPVPLSATDQAAIQRAYDIAYNNYRLSDYPSAIRGFDSFLKSYPKHALAPNAQYWIGECYSQLRQYREAIEAERRLLGAYPESAKAPDALLIIGTAESSLGDNPAARKTFEELIARYPGSESAEKAKGRLAKLK